MTATVKFTDGKSLDDIHENLFRIPLHPRYLAHHHNEYTYPIQDIHTREMVHNLKRTIVIVRILFYRSFC